MTKTQAGNALTLAELLKTKYAYWDFGDCTSCAIGMVYRNRGLFGHKRHAALIPAFSHRVYDLLWGDDLLKGKKEDSITQPQFRKALLKVIDQEGWEEA